MRHRWFTLGILAIEACAARSRPAAVAPPAYPWRGFGRIGCYAGPSLSRMSGSSTELPPDAAARGPWLVLDSLTRAESRDAGYRDSAIDPGNFHPGSLLQRRDTLEWIRGTWQRVAPDSIVFEEGSVFPPVIWHLRVLADSIVGEGVLVHDVVVVAIDTTTHKQTSHTPVSRWAVHLRRVDCADVPRIPMPSYDNR